MNESLARQNDKRVNLTGVFEKLHKHPARNYQVALLQDVTVETGDGEIIDVGHTWIQDADTLIGYNFEENERISCSCRVAAYEGKEGETKYGFRYPTQVHKIRPPAIRIPRSRPEIYKPEFRPIDLAPEPVPGLPPDLSVASAIREVRSLAGKLGGIDRLKEIVLELDA